jgi:hypothetical protein
MARKIHSRRDGGESAVARGGAGGWPWALRLRRPVMSALACALILGCSSYEVRTPVARWEGDGARVELRYQGEALAIHAAGDFNDWNPGADPFIRGEEDEWTCVLHLPPGQYAYLLVVETGSEESWRLDPGNPRRTRDFLGRELSLLLLESGNAGDDGDENRSRR